MSMLLGHYFVRLTEKGRTAIPKRFKEEIGEDLILAKWYEGCVVVVGASIWEQLLNRLTAKTNFVTQPVRTIDRFVLGSAYEVKCDNQGRFVLPRVLIDYAKLGPVVVFVWLNDRVEIW